MQNSNSTSEETQESCCHQSHEAAKETVEDTKSQADHADCSTNREQPAEEAPCSEPAEDTTDGAACQEGTCEKEEHDKESALVQQLEEMKDRLLRLTAEFDNYRKRTLKERAELIGRASGDTLLALLPVVDDFDRAVISAKESDNLEALLQGLELIQKNLYAFLKNQGISEIQSIGLELDTDFHHAITTTPVENAKQKGKIVDVIKKGYLLNGTVLRHAEVVVGK